MILLLVLLASGIFNTFLQETVDGFFKVFGDIAVWVIGLFA
jgi:hypothetical protein